MFATRLSALAPCTGFSNRSGLPARLPARWGIIPLIAAAYGVGRGLIGAIQGNQVKQRNKGLISQAYRTGRQRLDLGQQDQRQSIEESAGQRGLAQGGGVRLGGAVQPLGEGAQPSAQSAAFAGGNVSGATRAMVAHRFPGTPGAAPVSVRDAYDLGSQQSADLGREQQLGQTELARERDTALATNNADYANTVIGSVGSGISGAFGLAGASGGGAGTVQNAFGGSGPLPTPYPNSWQGIDPVDPLGRGAWASPQENSNFNVYSQDRRG